MIVSCLAGGFVGSRLGLATRRISQPKMGPLSETAKKWLLGIPAVIAGVFAGRCLAEMHNLQNEQHAMAMQAIKLFAQEIQKREMERKSNSANTVRRDAAGSKDGI
ncbi:uncharacterized protein LOC114284441 isoform X2 [Camellia sinensis]|nr:uncharacterized protein LOC114284441 isoform X2 [Camellia sinensis]XP_028083141.1 uncharacterized protein LOC114284441 isoform X2 [Camellia sinensis]